MNRQEDVFKALDEMGLTLKPAKCMFRTKKVELLGFVIEEGGIQPGKKKVEAISKFLIPHDAQNAQEVRRSDLWISTEDSSQSSHRRQKH